MGSVFRELCVDCADPRTLSRFWGEVLGWPVVDDEQGYSWVSSTGRPDAPAPILVFVPVPEPKSVKNRLHIDVNPSGVDQAEELQRLERLGARHVDIGQRDVPWFVLADPEGNEFCLLARRVDQP
jgi:catechol 2,3-dioxygenase-like lactoylglutathione lyase family enzyme